MGTRLVSSVQGMTLEETETWLAETKQSRPYAGTTTFQQHTSARLRYHMPEALNALRSSVDRLIHLVGPLQGDAVTLIATSDVEEAIEAADRIAVMRDHAIVGA